MDSSIIYYKGGYKYQLQGDVSLPLFGYWERVDLSLDYVKLKNNALHIKGGYAWDGLSGPTKDTENSMRGSLVHDALYQLMRSGRISRNRREDADKELRNYCKLDGMSSFRAWYVYRAVRMFGEKHTKFSEIKKIYSAP